MRASYLAQVSFRSHAAHPGACTSIGARASAVSILCARQAASAQRRRLFHHPAPNDDATATVPLLMNPARFPFPPPPCSTPHTPSAPAHTLLPPLLHSTTPHDACARYAAWLGLAWRHFLPHHCASLSSTVLFTVKIFFLTGVSECYESLRKIVLFYKQFREMGKSLGEFYGQPDSLRAIHRLPEKQVVNVQFMLACDLF